MEETTLSEIRDNVLLSLMDAVEELCMGLAHDQKPEPDWAEVVKTTFDQHRLDLRDTG